MNAGSPQAVRTAAHKSGEGRSPSATKTPTMDAALKEKPLNNQSVTSHNADYVDRSVQELGSLMVAGVPAPSPLPVSPEPGRLTSYRDTASHTMESRGRSRRHRGWLTSDVIGDHIMLKAIVRHVRSDATAANDPLFAVDEFIRLTAMLYTELHSPLGDSPMGEASAYADALRELATRIDCCVRRPRGG